VIDSVEKFFVFFASFQLLSPGFALPSPQYRPPKPSRPRSTPQSTCLIPHSRSCTVGCHTSRDFVPWRFSDASCCRAWIASSCRRPRNLNKSCRKHVQQCTPTEGSFTPRAMFVSDRSSCVNPFGLPSK
jgi:hypothetical protein